MQSLYPKIVSADRIVIVSPIYFYNVTAQTKIFIDRCQALWNRKRLKIEAGPLPEHIDRKGFLVSVAATRGDRVFEMVEIAQVHQVACRPWPGRRVHVKVVPTLRVRLSQRISAVADGELLD